MIGALAVFFIFNVFGRREKIFMGDSGSLLLGYLLTAFVFRFCEQNAYHVVPEIYHMSAAPAVAICVLTVPIFDTIRVSLTRIKHHCSPFKPDKNHIHHLLLRTGLNHIQTTCVLLSVSVVFIGLAILGRNWNMWLLLFADFALATVLTLILWRVLNKKLYGNNAND
jgi:UDP-N-acetylmuramyl pentapeptide phosphotransferase/UDP-N-acetylglucosamine-1-phosphate transferase